MPDVTFAIERDRSLEADRNSLPLHRLRAKRLHALVDTLGLEVRDWGGTDDATGSEIVEIIVALGSAGAFTAMVAAFKVWAERDKIKRARIKLPNGTFLELLGASARDIEKVIQSLGLSDSPAVQGGSR